LEKLLRGKAALKRLIRTELLADAESFGDERRTQLVERAPAQALDENDLVASEPVSIILSARGWVRAAKGHEIDAGTLAYKSGDEFQAVAKGRSNQPAVFLDSTGRAYSLMAHTLPSARGQGEPLSGRFNPPDGAEFRGVLGADSDQRCLLATSAGYGFFARVSDLFSRNRAGKSVLRVPEGAGVLMPVECPKSLPLEELSVAALSDTGRLLVFPATELPELARGKGNKILALPRPKGGEVPEFMCGVTVVGPKQSLVIDCGARHMTLKPRDLAHYAGVRGRRGSVLPRGWRKVTGIRTV
jgi:topoisomerase-4 subunit A